MRKSSDRMRCKSVLFLFVKFSSNKPFRKKKNHPTDLPKTPFFFFFMKVDVNICASSQCSRKLDEILADENFVYFCTGIHLRTHRIRGSEIIGQKRSLSCFIRYNKKYTHTQIYISSTMVDVNYLFRRTVSKKLFGAEITMAAIGELIRIQNEETR